MSENSKAGTALVTGASSGIGATYAEKLAARGYDLLLVARNEERLTQLGEKLVAAHGVKVETFKADLSNSSDILKVEKRLRDDEAITLIVNNAGVGPKGKLLDDDIDYLDDMIALNVVSVNRLAIAAAQTFAARGRGAIINIASVVALIPEVYIGTYAATKAFVLALTQSLGAELKDTGVKVQAVLPGLTRTEIFDRAGGSIEHLNPEMVMEATDLVDAALAGFDQGELITIPSLADKSLLDAANAARGALGPHLSLRKPASRYGVGS